MIDRIQDYLDGLTGTQIAIRMATLAVFLMILGNLTVYLMSR